MLGGRLIFSPALERDVRMVRFARLGYSGLKPRPDVSCDQSLYELSSVTRSWQGSLLSHGRPICRRNKGYLQRCRSLCALSSYRVVEEVYLYLAASVRTVSHDAVFSLKITLTYKVIYAHIIFIGAYIQANSPSEPVRNS